MLNFIARCNVLFKKIQSIFFLGPGIFVPVTAFRLLAGLKPINKQLTTLDLSFCKLDNLLAGDESMKVGKNQVKNRKHSHIILDSRSVKD